LTKWLRRKEIAAWQQPGKACSSFVTHSLPAAYVPSHTGVPEHGRISYRKYFDNIDKGLHP
jgi:hypothetical protein